VLHQLRTLRCMVKRTFGVWDGAVHTKPPDNIGEVDITRIDLSVQSDGKLSFRARSGNSPASPVRISWLTRNPIPLPAKAGSFLGVFL